MYVCIILKNYVSYKDYLLCLFNNRPHSLLKKNIWEEYHKRKNGACNMLIVVKIFDFCYLILFMSKGLKSMCPNLGYVFMSTEFSYTDRVLLFLDFRQFITYRC